mmetsp:Transcript_64982/g.209303  ORF Transcript_64982/g.209303 Transcript_64982/m.209303 type:complete len:242 (-) Transcript_64982:1144-1869(-)
MRGGLPARARRRRAGGRRGARAGQGRHVVVGARLRLRPLLPRGLLPRHGPVLPPGVLWRLAAARGAFPRDARLPAHWARPAAAARPTLPRELPLPPGAGGHGGAPRGRALRGAPLQCAGRGRQRRRPAAAPARDPRRAAGCREAAAGAERHGPGEADPCELHAGQLQGAPCRGPHGQRGEARPLPPALQGGRPPRHAGTCVLRCAVPPERGRRGQHSQAGRRPLDGARGRSSGLAGPTGRA